MNFHLVFLYVVVGSRSFRQKQDSDVPYFDVQNLNCIW